MHHRPLVVDHSKHVTPPLHQGDSRVPPIRNEEQLTENRWMNSGRRWKSGDAETGEAAATRSSGLRRASHLFWTAPPTAGRPCPGQRRCEGHRCCRSELELEAAACEEKLQLPAVKHARGMNKKEDGARREAPPPSTGWPRLPQ